MDPYSLAFIALDAQSISSKLNAVVKGQPKAESFGQSASPPGARNFDTMVSIPPEAPSFVRYAGRIAPEAAKAVWQARQVLLQTGASTTSTIGAGLVEYWGWSG